MWTTVKDPAKWMAFHLGFVTPATRRRVRRAATEQRKWQLLRAALAGDPASYPTEYARPKADRLARLLTGKPDFVALVAALLIGKRPRVLRPKTRYARQQLERLRRHLGSLALEV